MENTASSIAAGAKKLRAGISPVEELIALKRNPLVAVDHDPVRRRLDRHHQPLAGPA
jgi:hypothetical protein